MSERREQIVRRFVPRVARITAVSDPDGLLRDPGVFEAIQAQGFSIVQFEDSVSFRYDYESRFRSKWDAGGEAELFVVFKPADRDFETLPADVLANAQRVSFSLKDIFPKLSYAVISQLETFHFDALHRAHQQHATQPHDDAQTRGFVLRHVFSPQDWLTYAYRYAQATVLWTQISPPARSQFQKQFPELRGYVNQQFFDWLSKHYGGLYNYPASSPLMVHHIPGLIAHHLVNNPSQRVAFILIDGLAIDQWLILKDSLRGAALMAPSRKIRSLLGFPP